MSSYSGPLAPDKIPLGDCPNCGYVSGDDVDYQFPNPSECNECGSKLEKTTMATQFEINQAQEESA